MESLLLTLALSVCAKDSTTCSYTEVDQGKGVVVTACGLLPDREGEPISYQVYLEGKKYTVALEPRCLRV